jgi:hypothetical protein
MIFMPLQLCEVGSSKPEISDINVTIYGYCDNSLDLIKTNILNKNFNLLTKMGGEYTLVYEYLDQVGIITSPIGAIQYFYYYDGKEFFHGKYILDIIAKSGLQWDWDWESVGDLCEQENLTENRTMHNAIRRVPPGTILQFKEKLVVRTKPFLDSLKTYEADPLDAVEIFNQETSKWIGSNPVLSLSGGFDSRVILSSMLSQQIYPRIVTLGDENCSDIQVARQISRYFSLEHTIVNLSIDDFLHHAEDIAVITNGSKPACHWHTYLYPKKAAVSNNDSFYVGTLGEFARCYYFDKGILSLLSEAIPKYSQLRFWQLKLARHRTFRNDELRSIAPLLAQQINYTGVLKRAERNALLSRGDFLAGGSRYYLEQRVPNFYANGISMYNATSQWRSPFHNIHWLEHIWSLSDHWKLGSNWHRLAIQKNFPKLLDFPEEKGFRTKKMMSKAPPLYWLPLMQRAKYKSYDLSDSWFKDLQIRSLILDNSNLIDDVIEKELCELILDEHKEQQSRMRAISFILTILIYKLALANRRKK